MLLSELQNIMVNKVTFVGFRVVYRPNRPPPRGTWIRPYWKEYQLLNEGREQKSNRDKSQTSGAECFLAFMHGPFLEQVWKKS